MDETIFDHYKKVFELFFNLLWLKTRSGKKLNILIPDTIIIKNSQLDLWYFTDKQGNVMKKNVNSINPKIIEKKFYNKNSRHDVCAVYLYKNKDDNNQINIEYLDHDGLVKFLSQPKKKTSTGILQSFIDPNGDRETVVEINWTPYIQLITRRESNKCISNKKHGIYERCCTFDGPAHFSTLGPIGESLSQRIKDLLARQLKHIRTVTQNNQIIDKLTQILKQVYKNDLYVLFSNNMILNPACLKNHNSKKKQPLLPELDTYKISDDMEYNFDTKANRTKLVCKDILCIHCSKMRAPGTFVEIENHKIMLAHSKLRADSVKAKELISVMTALNVKRIKEENDPTSKKNWLHYAQVDTYEDSLNLNLNKLRTDYLKLENLMPQVFRKTLHIKYSQFEILSRGREFLLSKSSICNECYDTVTSLVIEDIQIQHLKINFSNKQQPKPQLTKEKNFLISDDVKRKFLMNQCRFINEHNDDQNSKNKQTLKRMFMNDPKVIEYKEKQFGYKECKTERNFYNTESEAFFGKNLVEVKDLNSETKRDMINVKIDESKSLRNMVNVEKNDIFENEKSDENGLGLVSKAKSFSYLSEKISEANLNKLTRKMKYYNISPAISMQNIQRLISPIKMVSYEKKISSSKKFMSKTMRIDSNAAANMRNLTNIPKFRSKAVTDPFTKKNSHTIARPSPNQSDRINKFVADVELKQKLSSSFKINTLFGKKNAYQLDRASNLEYLATPNLHRFSQQDVNDYLDDPEMKFMMRKSLQDRKTEIEPHKDNNPVKLFENIDNSDLSNMDMMNPKKSSDRIGISPFAREKLLQDDNLNTQLCNEKSFETGITRSQLHNPTNILDSNRQLISSQRESIYTDTGRDIDVHKNSDEDNDS